jgi:hypothetical protein
MDAEGGGGGEGGWEGRGREVDGARGGRVGEGGVEWVPAFGSEWVDKGRIEEGVTIFCLFHFIFIFICFLSG